MDMKKTRLAGLLLLILALAGTPRPAQAQLSGTSLYEVGGAATNVGSDEGDFRPAYGVGLGGTFVLSKKKMGIVAGGEIRVRGFGIRIPERAESGAGVFAQTDLLLDQWIAVRIGRVQAGLLLEERRIDRGAALGILGHPALGVGGVVEVRLDASGRTTARLSYARFAGGNLRLEGTEAEPEIDSGHSLRARVRRQLKGRWSAQLEYGSSRFDLDPVTPTFAFFDHRQTAFGLGALVSF
jgi:hypothetical protein